jgi:hypothetical protein
VALPGVYATGSIALRIIGTRILTMIRGDDGEEDVEYLIG